MYRILIYIRIPSMQMGFFSEELTKTTGGVADSNSNRLQQTRLRSLQGLTRLNLYPDIHTDTV